MSVNISFKSNIFRGFVLVLAAPVILSIICLLLSFFPLGSIWSGGSTLFLIILCKAFIYGAGTLLVAVGCFQKKFFISGLLSVFAFFAVFTQLMPPQISPSVMDIVLMLPGLTLVFLLMAVYLPAIDNRVQLVLVSLLCIFVAAYKIFQALALFLIPYALPSFYEVYFALSKLSTVLVWFIYLLILSSLFGSQISSPSFKGGMYHRTVIIIIAAAVLLAIIIMSYLYLNLEESVATVQYIIEPYQSVQRVDLILPLPLNEDGKPLMECNSLKVNPSGEFNLDIVNTKYGDMLHFIYEDQLIQERLIIEGQLESKGLGWLVGKEGVPAYLSPRIAGENRTLLEVPPIFPEHSSSVYTAVKNNSEGRIKFNYSFEMVSKGVKNSSYRQIFSSYLPLNYVDGIKLETGWQPVPMIEEIFIGERD